jgi:hypothetical protein
VAEHGLLFTDALALRIHQGRKLVTRRPITKTNSLPILFFSSFVDRGGFADLDWDAHQIQPATVVQPQPGATKCTDRCQGRDYCCCLIDGRSSETGGYLHVPGVGGETRQRVCCRVKPGDSIVVRECSRPAAPRDPGFVLIQYRAGGFACCQHPDGEAIAVTNKWRPSLLMPRWAARSVRVVTSVAPEKLEPLSPAEAEAEGFDSPEEFAATWDAVYGPKGKCMAARPWVWRIEFAAAS